VLPAVVVVRMGAVIVRFAHRRSGPLSTERHRPPAHAGAENPAPPQAPFAGNSFYRQVANLPASRYRQVVIGKSLSASRYRQVLT
jgi:hypothetical protein